jgi:hypothetical protein
MEIPKDLAAWDLALIRNLVAAADYEPGWFDFKAVMTGPGSITDSVRKAACAMANTDGGYLIFGVKDRVARKPGEDPVIGLTVTTQLDLRKEFGDLAQVIRRPIRFDCSPKAIAVDADGTRGVFVAQIPRSLIGPHEFEGKFWMRGDQGACRAMEFHEVRDHMLLSEDRQRKVTLLRLELRDMVLTSKAMNEGIKGNANLAFDSFDTSAFKGLIADTCAILPPESGLLETLLVIARHARRANETSVRLSDHFLLNWRPGEIASPQGWPAEHRRSELFSSLYGDRQQIERLCNECEATLKKLFGPLPGS